jgi:hypothetical protein
VSLSVVLAAHTDSHEMEGLQRCLPPPPRGIILEAAPTIFFMTTVGEISSYSVRSQQ